MDNDKKLNEHGQPILKGFNSKRNAVKAFENLLGIVSGIQGDVNLTKDELFFLQAWLIDQDYLVNDPDVVDLLDAINDVLADGILTQSEKDDISCLLSDFLEYRDDYNYLEQDLQQSIKRATGVFAGLSADDQLSDKEVIFLKNFLDTHSSAREYWPLSSVARLVDDALADGFLSGNEKEAILMMLHDAIGGSFSSDGSAAGKTTNLPLDNIDFINFKGKTFCFTGALISGTRAECSKKVIEAGGLVSSGITKNLDYLVLGPIASRDWFNSSYGRKIEKAVKYRDEDGLKIKIISESTWLQNL
ncbi:BRCT domain-containing protein [Thiomicrorhabdus sp. Milos-T2]|uniref:BRCT domain-containing protein n=1 Tax=Thiomicrorhabdus sp. Milos-T2 TaxID=90814 RepID=UPI000494B143|nr:BRCT domain-containing protein [Thiomicrorhabdus sp. Milos-T2]